MTKQRKPLVSIALQATLSGFLKSRFLDDKLSVGILLGYAKYLKDNDITPERKIYHYITVYEEVGHDIKHGLIGSGVYASHGYERTHRDGIKNTFKLLKAYLG